MTKEVFKDEFENGEVPENFVQKITYSSGHSNGLIKDLRTEKDFHIAVTVTLASTGTDVKPLEVVSFIYSSANILDLHFDISTLKTA